LSAQPEALVRFINSTSKEIIMATRTANKVNNATKTIAPEETQFSYIEYIRNMAAQVGVEIPTGKQMLAGVIVGLAVAILGSYAAGTIAAYVFMGAMLFTGSIFVAYLGMIIAFIMTAYTASIAASRAMAYVASGKLETDVVRAKDYVTGLFSVKKLVVSK
jgi:hypothetical protein